MHGLSKCSCHRCYGRRIAAQGDGPSYDVLEAVALKEAFQGSGKGVHGRVVYLTGISVVDLSRRLSVDDHILLYGTHKDGLQVLLRDVQVDPIVILYRKADVLLGTSSSSFP